MLLFGDGEPRGAVPAAEGRALRHGIAGVLQGVGQRAAQQLQIDMAHLHLEDGVQGAQAAVPGQQAVVGTGIGPDDELDGISAIPRQIEGVWVGVTLKQLKDRSGYKISMRSTEEADASAICARLGGGGHARAAGCSIPGSVEQAKEAILAAISAELQVK